MLTIYFKTIRSIMRFYIGTALLVPNMLCTRLEMESKYGKR